MSSLKEMTTIRPKVDRLLKEWPHLRDDDNKLIANIWHSEIDDINHLNAKDFLTLFAEGKLTATESIQRVRRKLQEENESYRGEKYKERHKEEKVIRKNINKK